jgi:hypothetical protein
VLQTCAYRVGNLTATGIMLSILNCVLRLHSHWPIWNEFLMREVIGDRLIEHMPGRGGEFLRSRFYNNVFETAQVSSKARLKRP